MSCRRFLANEVRLSLGLIACNLGNLYRRLARPKKIENWSLANVQPRLVKTGGRPVQRARHCWLLLAEGHLTRGLLESVPWRIGALPTPEGQRTRNQPAKNRKPDRPDEGASGRSPARIRGPLCPHRRRSSIHSRPPDPQNGGF